MFLFPIKSDGYLCGRRVKLAGINVIEINTANITPMAENTPHSSMADTWLVKKVIKAANVVKPASRTVVEIWDMAI